MPLFTTGQTIQPQDRYVDIMLQAAQLNAGHARQKRGIAAQQFSQGMNVANRQFANVQRAGLQRQAELDRFALQRGFESFDGLKQAATESDMSTQDFVLDLESKRAETLGGVENDLAYQRADQIGQLRIQQDQQRLQQLGPLEDAQAYVQQEALLQSKQLYAETQRLLPGAPPQVRANVVKLQAQRGEMMADPAFDKLPATVKRQKFRQNDQAWREQLAMIPPPQRPLYERLTQPQSEQEYRQAVQERARQRVPWNDGSGRVDVFKGMRNGVEQWDTVDPPDADEQMSFMQKASDAADMAYLDAMKSGDPKALKAAVEMKKGINQDWFDMNTVERDGQLYDLKRTPSGIDVQSLQKPKNESGFQIGIDERLKIRRQAVDEFVAINGGNGIPVDQGKLKEYVDAVMKEYEKFDPKRDEELLEQMERLDANLNRLDR